MKISLTVFFWQFAMCFALSQGCTLSTSNLTLLTGDDGSGNCTYSIDILFIEGSGPDNGTLSFSSTSATIFTGAGPHSCACSGTTYTLTFESPCNSTVTFDAGHDNSGNGNDCSVTSDPIALPVSWLTFEVQRDLNSVCIFWSTAAETNSDYFEVQYSENGKEFVSIHSIQGAGTSQVISTYEYVHPVAAGKTVYYRIKQVDYDGNFSYSEIRSISNPSDDRISVFPNPAQEILYVAGANDTAVLHLYDLSGRRLFSTSKSTVDVAILEPGLYFLVIDTYSGHYTRQFVKMQ